jgi:hypothetical protein
MLPRTSSPAPPTETAATTTCATAWRPAPQEHALLGCRQHPATTAMRVTVPRRANRRAGPASRAHRPIATTATSAPTTAVIPPQAACTPATARAPCARPSAKDAATATASAPRGKRPSDRAATALDGPAGSAEESATPSISSRAEFALTVVERGNVSPGRGSARRALHSRRGLGPAAIVG